MIELDPTATGWANLISAVVLGSFAVAVGALARFEGAARWYAFFGGGFGAAIAMFVVANNLVDPATGQRTGVALTISTTVFFAALIPAALWLRGTIGLVDHYGGRPFRWIGWTGSGLFLLFGLPNAFAVLDGTAEQGPALMAAILALRAVNGWMAAAPVMLALARRRAPQAGQAILAAAMAAYPIAFGTWAGLRSYFDGLDAAWLGVPALATFVALVVAWSWPDPSGSRAGLGVIGVGGFFFLLGGLLGLYRPEVDPSSIARTFDVLLVAYAILRLQYLGIDAKVRFGISKTTVAAVFLAVIFLVSEGAQVLFGEGNEWLGLAAGGALVFALAPLSRFADRVAERAVPIGDGGRPDRVAGGAEDRYRAVLERFLADGDLSSEEARTLAHLAEDLGIGAGRAHDLRCELEGRAARLGPASP